MNRDSPMTNRVGAGSSSATLANIVSNTGITFHSSTVTAITATPAITSG
jgi:hypothetical protein